MLKRKKKNPEQKTFLMGKKFMGKKYHGKKA